jgi:type IV pilus assembly protein PilP
MRKITFIALIMIFVGLSDTAGTLAADEVKKTPILVAKTDPLKQQLSAPQLPINTVPAIQTAVSTYSYNPAGKPDPFRPFVEDEVAAKKREEKKKVSSIFPLQRMEVEQFKLVGIAGGQNRRLAMVEDMTKKFYPLSIGTRIGINNGKVIEISSDRVIVEEYKTKKAKRIILKLHKN